MDIYKHLLEYLPKLSHASQWPDMRHLVHRAVPPKPPHWQLPVLACQAVGGNQEQAFPAVAAITCSQMAIMLIDDLLDEDPRGEHHRIGAGAASNLASAFQALGMDIIARCSAGDEVKLALLLNLNRMMLTTALGQYFDSKNPTDEDSYWRVVRTKSSPFFAAALYAGALLGGAMPETAAGVERFGHLYGEMVQIHDDLSDCMEVPANPDWRLGRAPLPILYAQTVAHDEQERFLELRHAISDPDALTEAQAILIRSGAVSYCVDRLIHRYRAGQEILGTTPVAYGDGLEKTLEEIIDQVRGLFSAVGIEQFEDLLQPSTFPP